MCIIGIGLVLCFFWGVEFWKRKGFFCCKYLVYWVKKYMPWNNFFLKMYKYSTCGGVGVLHVCHFHDLSWSQFSSCPGGCPGAVDLLSPVLHLRKLHWDHTRKCRQKQLLCFWGAVMGLLRPIRENPYFDMQLLCRTSSLCSCPHGDPSEMLSSWFLSFLPW